MEYIDGQELKNLAKVANLRKVLDYATQIAEGLKAAHAKGITHRDIKSSNIMLTESGQVKIMDFGLAKIGGGAQLTKEQSTLGTAPYMSPEQTRGEPVDHRTDIWSFGVVLYEMLTGQLPFRGEYEQAVIYSILNEDPDDVSLLLHDIPLKVRNVLNKCLEKDPANRFQAMDDVIAILEDFKNESNSQIVVVKEKSIFKSAVPLVSVGIVLITVLFFGWNFYENKQREESVRKESLPQLESLVDEIPGTGEGPKSWEAYLLSQRISDVIPDDPLLKNLQNKFLVKNTIITNPQGVNISIRAYADTSDTWVFLGSTPIDSVLMPKGFSIMKYEKEGMETARDLIWNASFIEDTIGFTLNAQSSAVAGMSYIPEKASMFNIKAAPATLHLPGLEQIKLVNCGAFYMDRFEVSNQEYKKFIDAGGYENKKFWKHPFTHKNISISWEDAMDRFVDKTGQPGPATWEVGDIPKGLENYPVAGISWFEAAAYAEYVGKSLPTIFHWDRVAFTWASPDITPHSNISGRELKPVDSKMGENRFGIYNLAGNVREWCFNDNWRGRFVLGGGWSDPPYAFNDAYAQSPFDRTEINGFRCIKYINENNKEKLTAFSELPWRDFMTEKPVSDETFSYFLKQYTYDKGPLNEQIVETENSEDWLKQKVSFTAAYGNEEMFVYLFLPKNTEPPYQTVIYFPGSGAMHTRSSKGLKPSSRSDYLLKSGRALVWPVYKSTFERGDNLVSDYPETTNLWKDHVIMWTKDFMRSVDYLKTRDDIDMSKLVYYGASWGGAMGGIIPAVERRLAGSILIVAGLQFQKTFPEVDAFNYLPRITVPVIMLNGKYDFFFPYDTAQLPFYKRLGTPEKEKLMYVYDGGHSVPRNEQVKEVLNWLDKYFGKVKKQ
ncbi:protein kinase, partial [candidate division KSB1 bacterium]|nr:protein kinase [candidate division KSB1 bacterium]